MLVDVVFMLVLVKIKSKQLNPEVKYKKMTVIHIPNTITTLNGHS